MREEVLSSATEELLKLDPSLPATGPEGPRRRWIPFSGWHFFLLPFALFMLMPLLWTVTTALELPSQAGTFPPKLIPQPVTFGNFSRAWSLAPMARWFANTVVQTGTIVLVDLVLASLAAYAFARIRFRGREVLFFVFLTTLMVPFQLTVIPTFIITKNLGLVDSLGGLIVPNLGSVFGIFLLRQFFRSLPIELEEAATIDGASRLGVLLKIVLPLSVPALVTLALLELLNYWNDFFWSLIIINTPNSMPLQLGLSTFSTAHTTNFSLLTAATVMTQLPLVLAFLFAQRYFVRSVAFSGLK
jgi:multiple sugar transport system permease protein